MRTHAAVVLTLSVLALDPRPTIAQSSSGFDIARTSFTSVREYVATDAVPNYIAAPPNVVVSDTHRALLERMLQQSPTFRRQCVRIAAERKLFINIGFAPPYTRTDLRATTFISRQANGRITASITIAPVHDTVEMIAHEFEHIIEQLDGVDLAARAARPRSGVHEQSGTPGVFETVRATRIGQRVAAEVRE
jgi:hypothetical protein